MRNVLDRISRKKTLVLGSICMFMNMLLWALAGIFNSVALLFIGSILRGIGLALKSGTDTAMIYETLEQIRQRRLFMDILSKISSFYQLGALIATFAATFITYYFSLQTLVCLAVIPSFLNIIVISAMVNPKSHFEKGMSPLKQLQKSLKTFVKNAKLRKYALLQIMNNALLVVVYRFEATYFEKLIPLYFLNIARALQHAMGWISYQIVPLVSKINLLKLIYYSSIGNATIRIIGLIMNNPITPFFNTLQNLFYGTAETSSTTLLQKEYSRGLRATLASIVGLFGNIALALLGYIFGLAADIYSPRTILFVGAFCGIALAFAYKRLFRPIKPKK